MNKMNLCVKLLALLIAGLILCSCSHNMTYVQEHRFSGIDESTSLVISASFPDIVSRNNPFEVEIGTGKSPYGGIVDDPSTKKIMLDICVDDFIINGTYDNTYEIEMNYLHEWKLKRNVPVPTYFEEYVFELKPIDSNVSGVITIQLVAIQEGILFDGTFWHNRTGPQIKIYYASNENSIAFSNRSENDAMSKLK